MAMPSLFGGLFPVSLPSLMSTHYLACVGVHASLKSLLSLSSVYWHQAPHGLSPLCICSLLSIDPSAHSTHVPHLLDSTRCTLGPPWLHHGNQGLSPNWIHFNFLDACPPHSQTTGTLHRRFPFSKPCASPLQCKSIALHMSFCGIPCHFAQSPKAGLCIRFSHQPLPPSSLLAQVP